MRRRVVVVQYRHAGGPAATAGRAILHRRLPGLHAARVLRLVKVREQPKEQETVKADPDHETTRIITLDEEQLELMAHDHHELHLKSEK